MIALVLLGVSTVAFGIGAGIVSAIHNDIVQGADQIAAPGPVDDAEEADSLATLMERLQAEQELVGEADPTTYPQEDGDADRGGQAALTR